MSEIPFLFYNDYLSYSHCTNIIKNYELNNKNTFWEIIEEIINYLLFKKQEKYIIVFDQYNTSNDPDKKINNLIKKNLKNKKGNIRYFSFMSLNNKDVRNFKIKNILNEQNDEYSLIMEINDIIYDGNFSNSKFQKLYEKIGKTIENFCELSQQKEKYLNEYYKIKKEKIKKDIIQYYTNQSGKFQLQNIQAFMSISIDIEYTEEEIKSLFDNIHFKYFDVKKEGDNIFKIYCLFPIIEECLKEIYYSIIYDNQSIYEKILNFDLIKGGGKGFFFEQIVVSNLSPSSSTKRFDN